MSTPCSLYHFFVLLFSSSTEHRQVLSGLQSCRKKEARPRKNGGKEAEGKENGDEREHLLDEPHEDCRGEKGINWGMRTRRAVGIAEECMGHDKVASASGGSHR